MLYPVIAGVAAGALLSYLVNPTATKNVIGVGGFASAGGYDLHSADASRFKAMKELLLLEDHINTAPCMDCMNKHAATASGLLSEAATLKGGDETDVAMSNAAEGIRRRLTSKPRALAGETRELRRAIARRLGLSPTETGHNGHKHD